jgi:hypothetical protein
VFCRCGHFVPGSSFLSPCFGYFVAARFVPRSSFLGVLFLEALGALDSLGSRRPLPASDCLASLVASLFASCGWMGRFKGVLWEGLSRRACCSG